MNQTIDLTSEYDSFAETKALAEEGHREAQGVLAWMYEGGFCGAPKDEGKAFNWLFSSATKGHPIAQFHVGECFDEGWGGAPKDPEEALKWYLKAAHQGSCDARLKLGLKFEDGDGVPQDEAWALALFGLAAESNDETTRALAEREYNRLSKEVDAETKEQASEHYDGWYENNILVGHMPL